MHLFRFLVPRLLATLAFSWFAVASAQTAGATLPTATTTQGIEALTHAIESLLASQYSGFEIEVETVSSINKGDYVDAAFRVTIRRDEAYLVEVARTLLPFNGACQEPMRCETVRFFGTGEPFGRAGFLDVAIPDEKSGNPPKSLYTSLTNGFNYDNQLAVVVELRDGGGQPVGRAIERVSGYDGQRFPLGTSGYVSKLDQEGVQGLLGPHVVEVKLTDVQLAIWERATNVEVTLMGDNVSGFDYSSLGYAISAGMYLPEADAAELFVEPGLLLFNEDSNWDLEGNLLTPGWIGYLNGSTIITHVDGERVASPASVADALFRAKPILEFTVWEQATDSLYQVTCEAAKSRVRPPFLPTNYPLEDRLDIIISSSYGSELISLERGVSFNMLVLDYDCTDLW